MTTRVLVRSRVSKSNPSDFSSVVASAVRAKGSFALTISRIVVGVHAAWPSSAGPKSSNCDGAASQPPPPTVLGISASAVFCANLRGLRILSPCSALLGHTENVVEDESLVDSGLQVQIALEDQRLRSASTANRCVIARTLTWHSVPSGGASPKSGQ